MNPLKLYSFLLASILVFMLASCSPSQNSVPNPKESPGDPSGKPTEYPDISGYWQDLEADLVAVQCNNETFSIMASLTLVKPDTKGKLSGILSLEDATGFVLSGEFTGSLSKEGSLTGSINLSLDQGSSALTVNLRLKDESLSGQLTFVNPATCADNKTPTQVVLNLKLQLIPNDAYEPNNNPQTATVIEPDFSETLVLNPSDADWFSFSLSKAAAITFTIDTFAKGSLFMEILHNNASRQMFTFDTNSKEQTLDLLPGNYSFVLYAEPKVSEYSLALQHKPYPDDELEPNDRVEEAKKLATNSETVVYLAPGDQDWFNLTIAEAQVLKLELIGDASQQVNIRLFDENQKEVFSTNYYGEILDVIVPKGSYYLLLEGNHNLVTLELSSEAFSDKDSEPNDTKDQASPIAANFSGSFFIYPEDEDWFSFNLSSSSSVLINKGFDVTAKLYNSDGQVLLNDSFYAPIELNPGTYYLQFSVLNFRGSYTFSVQSNSLSDSYEPNEERSSAHPISSNFTGSLVVHPKDQDWFRFSLSKSSFIDLSTTNSSANTNITLSDENAKTLSQLGSNSSKRFALAAGTYYLHLQNETELDSLTLSLVPSPVPDDAREPNDQPQNATPLDLSQSYAGSAFISINDRECYSFNVFEESLLLFYSEVSTSHILYNESFVAFSPQKYTGTGNDLMAVLAKGRHSLCFTPSGTIPLEGRSINLRFAIQSYRDDSYEPNDLISTASPISANFRAQDLFLKEGPNAQDKFNDDWYRFELSERALVSISFSQITENYRRDSFSLQLLSADASTNLRFSADLQEILPAGTYYLRVGGEHRFEHWEFGAKYRLSLTSSAF